ncbi:zinc knuckle-domain-containing protein, partial [Apiospora arundinis]
NALNEISRTYSQVHAHKANISLRHYSYECKAAAQERPYISRPSRTQQLFNPKLAPKLTEAKPPALESKQGVADQELAKLEAERAKKRELERDDDEGSERGEISKRRRSASYDSVSTISTGRSRSRSPSPARDLSRSPSPVRRAAPSRSATPDQRRPQRRGYSRDSRSVERSLSPVGRARDSYEKHPAEQSSRRGEPARRRPSRSSPRSDRSRSPAGKKGFRSRSPQPPMSRTADPHRRRDGPRAEDYMSDRQGAGRSRDPAPRSQQRERSLSPFSKRLALTQTMNTGR